MNYRLCSALMVFALSVMELPGINPQMAAPDRIQEEGGFKVSIQSQLVEIYVTVTKENQFVPNLQASDFELTEDGAPVSIDRLDDQDVPLQVVLLLDISESVLDTLHTIQDAAAAFVESLHPEDRVTLVFFNSDIRFYSQTTNDRGQLLKEIKGARARGLTKLHDALLFGMKWLEGKSGRKAIVCFTDGQDTASTSSRTSVMNAAARSGYPIYAIGAGAGLELESLKIILRRFVEINGGRAFFMQNLRRLRQAFAEISAELRSAYVLNYYTRVPADGRWHDLDIRTPDPAYSVQARKGFFARNDAGRR